MRVSKKKFSFKNRFFYRPHEKSCQIIAKENEIPPKVWDELSKGPVTQSFTAKSRPNHVKKLFPVKQMMLFALLSSLRRAIVNL